MHITLKPFNHKTDLLKQRELFCSCFPETSGLSVQKDDHYFWKFHSFPTEESKSYEYSAYREDALIGYYAALPFRYYINNEIRTCGMVCDVMTHPEMQGKGIFTKIGLYSTDKLKECGVDFTTGYPIRPEVIPGHLKVGWKIAFILPMYILPLRADFVLSGTKLNFLTPMLNRLVKLYLSSVKFFNRPQRVYTHETMNVDEFSKIRDYDCFYEKWRQSIKNVLIKDLAFIRWRTNAPGCDYKYIVIRHEGQIVAVSIVRYATIKAIPCLAILDLMILEGYYDCISVFNDIYEQLSLLNGLDTIVAMLSRYWAKKYRLIRTGYIKSPYIFRLIIKKLNDHLLDFDLFNEMNWHLMWIDSDDL